MTILDRIVPAFRGRALQRAARNEKALRDFGIYTSNEFNDLKDNIVEAYRQIGHTSAPVINMDKYAFPKFLKEGQYKNQGATGNSSGDYSPKSRLRYSNDMYGYESLPMAEKYGSIPMEELYTPEAWDKANHIPGSEYGPVRIHLKPNMKRYSTINAFDSINQWPDNSRTIPHAYLGAVPYEVEEPERYAGAFMDAPLPDVVEGLKEMGHTDDAIADMMRIRNDETLRLLQGRNPNDYVEAQIHGPITPDDIDFVEAKERIYAGDDIRIKFPELDDLYDKYGIQFIYPGTYNHQLPADMRREYEPRKASIDDWLHN